MTKRILTLTFVLWASASWASVGSSVRPVDHKDNNSTACPFAKAPGRAELSANTSGVVSAKNNISTKATRDY